MRQWDVVQCDGHQRNHPPQPRNRTACRARIGSVWEGKSWVSQHQSMSHSQPAALLDQHYNLRRQHQPHTFKRAFWPLLLWDHTLQLKLPADS